MSVARLHPVNAIAVRRQRVTQNWTARLVPPEDYLAHAPFDFGRGCAVARDLFERAIEVANRFLRIVFADEGVLLPYLQVKPKEPGSVGIDDRDAPDFARHILKPLRRIEFSDQWAWVEGVRLALKHRFDDSDVTAQDRLDRIDTFNLLEHEKPAVIQLCRPFCERIRGVGQVRDKKAAEDHVGGACGKRNVAHIVKFERNARACGCAREFDESSRRFEADDAAESERFRNQMGRKTGTASEVECKAELSCGCVAQERARRVLENVREKFEASRRDISIAEGVPGLYRGLSQGFNLAALSIPQRDDK